MVTRKKRKVMRQKALEAVTPPPRKFVVLPSSHMKFRQIVGMDGTLYGLDDEGQVFAYVPSSEAWVRLDGDDNHVVFLPPDEPRTFDESKFPEEIQKERAERVEKAKLNEAWWSIAERVNERVLMHTEWRFSGIEHQLKTLVSLLKEKKADGEAK